MTRRLLAHPVLSAAFVLILLSVLAPFFGLPLSLITEVAIYVLYGIGVNVMVGYTGLVPFGASVFFGTASYAAAISLETFLPNEILALLFAIVFSLVLGALLGLLILRRRGLYFSLLTVACSQTAFEIAYKWTALTGGENGLQDVPLQWLTTPLRLHAFTLVTVLGGLFLLWRLAHSPFGRLLQALRDNEQRVACLGYNPFLVKLIGFTLSAGAIGYAGGLLALMLQGAYANNLDWDHAGDALLMALLGGVHQFLGPLWGAIAFILLQDRFSAITENWWLLFAPVILLFVLFSPEGLQGSVQRLFRRERWTLTRPGIPARPAAIAPWQSTGAPLDAGRPILSVRGLTKRFGSLVTANNIDLDVFPCRLHSLIGPNGAGKTTFFNVLSGLLPANGGRVLLGGKDITRLPAYRRIRLGLSRSFQILSVFRNLTAFENVRIAVQAQSKRRLALFVDAYSLGPVNARTWSLLAAVGLAERAEEPCETLSHGEQRLLEIAISLATDAKILLLDEPLAGLAEADREVVGALIRKLADTHAVLLVEHDIDRVLALSDRISVLHQGRLIADGKPAEVAADPEVIAAYLGHAESAARPAASLERRDRPRERPLLTLEGLSAGYGASRILHELDLVMHEGEVLALLGRNGVGKTTLLRAVTGVAEIQSGRIRFGDADITGVKPYLINRRGISIVPEGRRLFPNLTLLDNLLIAARPGGAAVEEVLSLFPKLRGLQHRRAENLSGGERQMAAIARALMVPSKLILLDEPFEGLAPAIVQEVLDAVVRLRDRTSLLIVEHQAATVLPIADRAVVLVNGRTAFNGPAAQLATDEALQARLLGVAAAELHAA